MDEELLLLFGEFHEIPIWYYPLHYRITERLTTAIFLAYLMRQFRHHQKDTIFQTDSEVIQATQLSKHELATAKQDIKVSEIILIERAGAAGRTHYTINKPVFAAKLREHLVSRNPGFPKLGKQKPSGFPNTGKPIKRETTEEENILATRLRGRAERRDNSNGLGIPQSANGRGRAEPSSKEAQDLFFKLYRQSHGHDYSGVNGKHRKQLKEAFRDVGYDLRKWRAMLTAFFDPDFLPLNNDARNYGKHLTGYLNSFINLWQDNDPNGQANAGPGAGRIVVIDK